MFDLGLMIRIGGRLITHREEIGRLWPKIYDVIEQAMRLAPEVRALMEKIAPELLTSGTRAKAADIDVPKFDVKWLQRSLNRTVNAGLVVDGKMSPLTIAAIEKFQATHGLEVDGWAGAQTEAVLDQLRSKAA